jgi:uncharacterized membrane protein YfcA
MSYILVPLTAFLAGFINAMAGGGTFLTFPALTGIARLTDQAANVTSTIGLWPGAAASVASARAEFKHLRPALTVTLFVLSLVGGVVGAVLLLVTPTKIFARLLPWLLLTATALFAFSKPLARWARERGHARGGHSRAWVVSVFGLQFLFAIYGGYFGAGVGILMLSGLALLGLEDIHQMNALKVLVQTSINATASIVFLFSPLVDWRYAAPMAALSMAGGFMGISLARKLPQPALRAIILIVGVVVTAMYFVKNYG